MDITVTCPEVRCGRCGASTPVLPAVLRSSRRSAPVFVGNKLAVPVAGFSASGGGDAWQVVAASEPAEWGASPDGARLCPSCLAAWAETVKAFSSGTLSDRALRYLPRTRDLPPPLSASPAVIEELPRGVQRTPAPTGPPPRVDHHQVPAARAEVRASVSAPQRVSVAATPAMVVPRPGAVVSALPQVAAPSRVAPVPNVVHRGAPAPVPVVVRGQARVAPLPTASATQRVIPVEQATPAPASPVPSPVPAAAQRAAPAAQLASPAPANAKASSRVLAQD